MYCLECGCLCYCWLWIMQNQHGVRPKKTLKMNVKTLFIFQHHHFILASHILLHIQGILSHHSVIKRGWFRPRHPLDIKCKERQREHKWRPGFNRWPKIFIYIYQNVSHHKAWFASLSFNLILKGYFDLSLFLNHKP